MHSGVETQRGKMECHGLTDRGREREINEDQFLIADLRKCLKVHQTSLSVDDHSWLYGKTQGQLLLVADGLGGHEAGERASSMAVDYVAQFATGAMHWCFRLEDADDEAVLAQWKAALEQCDVQVHAESEANPRRRGMGTTLTMAYVIWPRAYIVHAGDSRCYLFRGGELEQITTDHTVAQRYVEAGLLTPEQARQSRWSHVLWNAIGGSAHDLSPEAHRATLEMGDLLLLCTDGLTKHVPDSKIRATLEASKTAADICRRLVDAANDAGGSDNITVVVAQFCDAQSMLLAASEEASAASSAEAAVEEPPKARSTA